jgi:hypothetical protein
MQGTPPASKQHQPGSMELGGAHINSQYLPFLLQAGHCGLPAENMHAQLWAFAS